MDLRTPLTEIKGIGEKTAKLFAKLQIYRIGDLLAHYPRNYQTFQTPVLLREAPIGELCSVQAVITGQAGLRHVRNLSILAFRAQDESAAMQITFFNMPYLKSTLKPGSRYIFYGILKKSGNGNFSMEHPKLYRPEEYEKLLHTLQPRYALTAGLTNQAVSKAVQKALDGIGKFPDKIPDTLRDRYGLTDLDTAMRDIHFPASYETMLQARKRLVFEEFLTFLISLRLLKAQNSQIPVERPLLNVADTGRLIEALPYALTKAQLRVWEEICEDLQKAVAMNRLIQGDVGSGKTILAFLALLMAAANGRQGCLMAPTEVLARQHYEALTAYQKAYHLCVKPVLLTGSMTAAAKRAAYESIASGEANVIIGTHALIQEKVAYRDVALVVTDEQHRFGVRQREALAGKGSQVHVLVMSATPIPRTLAILLYGDLHVSILDEMPAGRLPIKNCVVGRDYRQKAYAFIAKQTEAGHQAYVICPQVEEGELDDVENVTDYTEKLRAELPGLQIQSLHGKMKPAVKNQIMEAFARHDIDVLVSTTVIEVGINVPNATVMMVENAERFGLAQLHQLRGRVGRGNEQSYCIFVSGSDNKAVMKRLEILNHSNDGFQIANEDLKLRGPGDLFGIRQSGALAFAIGDIYQDADLLLKASEAADLLLQAAEGGDEAALLLLDGLLQREDMTVDFRSI